MLGVLIVLVLLALAVLRDRASVGGRGGRAGGRCRFLRPSACARMCRGSQVCQGYCAAVVSERSRWADGRAGMVEAMVPGVLDLRVLPVMRRGSGPLTVAHISPD